MLLKGFKSMLPISIGVLPFALVMGTVSYAAKLTATQTIGMNLLVFAGSSQIAVIELLLQKSSTIVVILTGLIINLRFMLYSAAFAPYLENSNLWVKIFSSYNLTDQSFATMQSKQSIFKNNHEAVSFYVGAALCMFFVWQVTVIIGFLFGNILPSKLALDYAIPLSFVALVIPTLKSRNYLYVAIASSVFAVICKPIPYNLGLLVATLLGLVLAAILTSKKFGQK
jgi:predicted branched-subunit amino acid permease